ncbi:MULTISPECIES: response regulator transcription factor [Peptostreptococcaceae]|uniref:response regulator transcription factor n=1 Tax=Peptostreptococcaceae TaxID=186804 RepID=UPI00038CC6E8|nr:MULTISPECIES: helix-turn-helix domain-containing protein [Paraclostridium]EQK44435.1 response regulator [[Clostridium] bifermentans ATCC 19299] [Paraclostridium bifermentans ATCC 19299]MBZ6004589.1 response regulator [Paraclostridium bifermentans]MCE9675112.1 response regulator [Paraclostridium bifermentans]MCR1874309.1 response regulator [Paraclostridium bifermentans]MDU0297829.1 response regulator [Paraclostridium sp. MRS3W1]
MLDIIVVEDEAPIRDWIAYTISNISDEFNVLASASNGKEAYELALNLKPKVIISDIKMPIMGGIELTKKIKEVFPDIYVILLTNYAEFSYAKEAISCGVYEYLVKSDIRPKELKEILDKVNESEKELEKNKASRLQKENTLSESKDGYSKTIKKSIDYIHKNYKQHISLQDISNYVFLSHEYFSRLFKEEVGENFSSYLTNYRMKKAESLIKNTDMKISQIAIEVGYTNASYFSRSYKKFKGISPEDDR